MPHLSEMHQNLTMADDDRNSSIRRAEKTRAGLIGIVRLTCTAPLSFRKFQPKEKL